MQTLTNALPTTFVYTCPQCDRHIHWADQLTDCPLCHHPYLHLSAQGTSTDMQQWLHSLLLGLDNPFKGI